ncbi:hypothetical protein ZIOFF_042897 [Zingiber officinale]|uniref:Uncharacterized protein n=1 Tax=Zingiber officinale TaxID=94328 RepID=A0A8J5FWE2_ZINOF|nr:hypothetical protein ZIOFF_042897 [Zingiber officinale]
MKAKFQMEPNTDMDHLVDVVLNKETLADDEFRAILSKFTTIGWEEDGTSSCQRAGYSLNQSTVAYFYSTPPAASNQSTGLADGEPKASSLPAASPKRVGAIVYKIVYCNGGGGGPSGPVVDTLWAGDGLQRTCEEVEEEVDHPCRPQQLRGGQSQWQRRPIPPPPLQVGPCLLHARRQHRPAGGAPAEEVPICTVAVSDGPVMKIRDGLVAAENDLSSDGVKQLSIVLHYDIPFTHNLWHISVLEDQKQEDAEKLDETNEPSDADPSSQINQNVSSNAKPDMNDSVMGESVAVSDTEQNSADDNNLANLDLNLGLKATYNERETKSRNSGSDEGDQVEKINLDEEIEMNNRTDSEVPNKLKRKKLSPLTSK